MNNNNNRLGLLFGGLAGDAFGSRYEFKSAEHVKMELKNDKYQAELLGGGPFMLEPGQITDDSELALTLIHSLKVNSGLYNQSLAAKYYIEWFKSEPFDIGNTMRRALTNASDLTDLLDNSKNNISSLSNGSLMRIWALLYYYYNKTDKELEMAVIEDCKLTHPNHESIELCILYSRILKYVMNSKNKTDIIILLKDVNTNTRSLLLKSVCDTILNNKEYILLDKKTIKLNNAGQYIGYIGLSFAIVMKTFLYNQDNILNFFTNIAEYGGDTDTNCCIGGALFGAYYGLNHILPKWVQQISKLKCHRYTKYPRADVLNFLLNLS